MVEKKDLYPARRCQYWSDTEPAPCKYWDFKYRLCSYWQATLDEGTVVKASLKGIDDSLGTSDGGELPDYAIPLIKRPTKHPHCNMLGTDTWCKYYVAGDEGEETDEPTEADIRKSSARCILPDQSRHVVRRNSGKKWVQIRTSPKFDTEDKRIMIVSPHMTYTHINAYEKLEGDFPDPGLDGKCMGLDKDYGQLGYCTWCEGYNPHHHKTIKDGKVTESEGWGLEFSGLSPEPRDKEYHPFPSPNSELDRPKLARYAQRNIVILEGDYSVVLTERSPIILLHEKTLKDSDGNDYTVIEDIDTVIVKAEVEIIDIEEYPDAKAVEETTIYLEDPVAEPELKYVYFGYSSIKEFGARLPLRYVIYNKRAELARCYWWKGSHIDFTASVVENPDLEGMHYVDIKGWDPSDYVSCAGEEDDDGTPMEEGGDSDCSEGELDKEHADFVGCTCDDALASLFYNPNEKYYNTDYHEVVPICNGAKPECPFYTSSVCWEYCLDEKMQQGDPTLPEQILELRYYSRKDKWTKESYDKAFTTPEIYAWSGPTQMKIDKSPNRTNEAWAIAAQRTYIHNFKALHIKKADVVLSRGVSAGVPNYPSLVEIIHEVRRSPIIRNSFDQDKSKNNVLEVTDLFHKYVLVFGETFHYGVHTYAVNIKDPELKDVLPEMLFKAVEDKVPSSMLEIESRGSMTPKKYASFYEELDCALEMLLKFAPEKMPASDYGDEHDMFAINTPSFWGDNNVYVFSKGSGVWEFDKIEFKKIFLGGVIAQTTFALNGNWGGANKRKTIDYLPMYESNFMTSENNNGSITFDFIPFTSTWGGKLGGKTEIAYVYNDSVVESQMCRGLPDQEEYEPGKPYTFGNGIDAYTRHIWQNSDAGGPFKYGLLKQYCDQGGMYMPQYQSGLRPMVQGRGGTLLGVISGHTVSHHLPAYPDEFNTAYEGDPTGILYGPRITTEGDGGTKEFTGERSVNSRYTYETTYKVYKMLVFNGFLYTGKIWHEADAPVTECDPEDEATCIGNLEFFGNAGYVVVTIPDEEAKLSNYPMPWGIEYLKPKGTSGYEETGLLMYENHEIVIPMYVQNPSDPSDEKPFPIWMEVVYKGDELPDNQMILRPMSENIAGLEPCSAFLRLKIYRFEKRSFGDTPEGFSDEGFEEIQDEMLASNPAVDTIVYRSLDYAKDDEGKPTGELLDSYDVPGEGANLTGAVRLNEKRAGNNRTSYEITGFDVDPLLISVVFKSSLTGRIRGMARTKMITWVRQPYCRDVWLNYAWQREYKVKGWNNYYNDDPQYYWFKPDDPRCIRDDIDNVTFRCHATSYSPLYPYTDYAPVQYDYQYPQIGWTRRFSLYPSSLEQSHLGDRVNSDLSPDLSTEASYSVRNGRQGHLPYYFRRHPYFTPEVWDSDKIEKHGFFDARMMVPSEKQAKRHGFAWSQPPSEYKQRRSEADFDAIGSDVKFIGLGMYAGGISEFEKDEYYTVIGDKTPHALHGHDVLFVGYNGLTNMNVYSGRKQYGGYIGFYANPDSPLVAHYYSQLPKWFPTKDMGAYPLKFGNVCRDYLSSFRSIDNIYYDKPGRIAASMYPDLKVRRERMVDPNKTGIFNGENPQTKTAYNKYVDELNELKVKVPDDSIVPPGTETTTPRKEAAKLGFAGVEIPDYYYRKWVPVNYSYTSCDITGSNVKDYPFDLYTRDYDSPFIHPMGLFLANTKIENIEIKEEIYMEQDAGEPTNIYARFSFEDVFCVDKLDIESFDVKNKNNMSTSVDVGIVHPAARYYEDDLERSLYWFVYRPFPIPPIADDYDEFRGKPDDWGEGVDTSVSQEEEDAGNSKLAIHWAWRERWKDLERQAVELADLQACTIYPDEDGGITRDTFEPSLNDPFIKDPFPGDSEEARGLGRFLFLDLRYPDYQMDGDLFEHRLVCSEKPDSDSVIIGPNYVIKFIPPPKTDEGYYAHHVFFIQLVTLGLGEAGEEMGGPPRGFTIGSDPLQDKDTIGRWDPEAMNIGDGDEELEIPGYDELSAKEVYDLYTKCCGTKDQVIDDWMRIDCPYCEGTGKVGLNNQECPMCYGDERVSPLTLLAKGYTDESVTTAETAGRITERYIDGENGYEIEEATYHRGLYAELLLDNFEFLPTMTKILDEKLYETCFALKDKPGEEGTATSILPETVNGEYVNAGEYNAFNSVNLEAPYNCAGTPGDVAEVIFDFVMAGNSSGLESEEGDTPQLRAMCKAIIQFEVGTRKDEVTGKVILYHEPAIRILAGKKGTRVHCTYSEEMTLTKKPSPGAPIGLINVVTKVCEWELTVDDYFDPQQYLRIEMRLKPTTVELEEQGLSGYYNNNNIVNKVKLMSAYLFYNEYATAIEQIHTYERKYHISVGGYGDIYPNRLSPNKNEEGELKHQKKGNVGRWGSAPNNINLWQYGLYPPGQSYRSRLSSVYEEDSSEGIIGQNNDKVDTTAELAYMSKCRGRICSETTETGSPLSGQATPKRFSTDGGTAAAAELTSTEGSLEDIHEWEKLQEKNYNRVIGLGGNENIKDAGNTIFQMTSVCPPGLEHVLEEMGVSEFPVWTCTFVNTLVPPLTPTIQYEPYNHGGYRTYHAYNPLLNSDDQYYSQYRSQVRNIFYEENEGLSIYSDWDYELENREMLRLQKNYYYNTIISQQSWAESELNYPYPVDAFHTMVRNGESDSPGWGCPAPELGEGWQWIYHFSTWWLGHDSFSGNIQNAAEDFPEDKKLIHYFPDPSYARFYKSRENFIKNHGSQLYNTRLVVDRKVAGKSGQGTHYITVDKKTPSEYDNAELYTPYLL